MLRRKVMRPDFYAARFAAERTYPNVRAPLKKEPAAVNGVFSAVREVPAAEVFSFRASVFCPCKSKKSAIFCTTTALQTPATVRF